MGKKGLKQKYELCMSIENEQSKSLYHVEQLSGSLECILLLEFRESLQKLNSGNKAKFFWGTAGIERSNNLTESLMLKC